MMPIVSLYAGTLALWFLVLSARVVQGRIGPNSPGIGDGGDVEMLRRIRGQANFTEYVPIILILIGLMELNNFPNGLIHALGITLLLGRLLHGYAFSFTSDYVFGRTAGILLTFLTLLISSICCLYLSIQNL